MSEIRKARGEENKWAIDSVRARSEQMREQSKPASAVNPGLVAPVRMSGGSSVWLWCAVMGDVRPQMM
jgi:hypothetical protein